MLVQDLDTNCNLHDCNLVETQVPVVYGLVSHSREFLRASKTRFPKSKFVVNGGCVQQKIYFHVVRCCPQCRDEHLRWAQEHQTKEGLAPTPEEHAKRYGYPTVIPDVVVEHVVNGNLTDAAKVLQSQNPTCKLSQIRVLLESMKKEQREANREDDPSESG